MASAVASTYKKKNGTLTTDASTTSLSWTPSDPPNASPSVNITVKDITNLQQTPVTNPKAALKVVLADESHTFAFNARADQEAVTALLRTAIAASKTTQTTQPPPTSTTASAKDATARPAAMAIAHAVSSTPSKSADEWYDDARLKSDMNLQRSLLDANPVLRQRFNESLRDRPESISISQFTLQFWSARLHLLRAHAIQNAQRQGDYNVLPDLKTVRTAGEDGGEGKSTIRIMKHQVALIFKQYPIVKEAYNKEVPRISGNDFWVRFFKSRLLRKLKGEKVDDSTPPDSILDKYLNYRENDAERSGQVPHFIDLEGNEQDHSQKGNRPDETMRPSSFDRIPILKALNRLSEKILSSVAAAEGEAHGPIGMDEKTYQEVQLRDLADDTKDNRVTLNIKDQQLLLAGDRGDRISAEASLYAQHSPNQVLSSLNELVRPEGSDGFGLGSMSLAQATGVQSEDEDSDDEAEDQLNGNGNKHQTLRIGSRSALTKASKDILSAIKTRRLEGATDPSSTLGLPPATFDNVTMTHNTTVEFLHYFWTLFLSGDGSRSNELAKLVETLDKSVDRLQAVSKAAEDEKQQRIDDLKKQMRGTSERSTKRRRLELDLGSIGGGKKVVDEMTAPTMKALAKATSRYRECFEKQSAAAA